MFTYLQENLVPILAIAGAVTVFFGPLILSITVGAIADYIKVKKIKI